MDLENGLNTLPCPFCGMDGGLLNTWPLTDKDQYSVVCVCTAEGPMKDTEAQAVEGWNRRSLSAPVQLSSTGESK